MLIIKWLFCILFISVISCETIYYKKNLRELYEKETNRIIKEIIENKYNFIYEQIINNAKIGFNELNFVTFCEGGRIESDLHLELPKNMVDYMFSILSKDDFTNKILDKIKQIFPDSNINKLDDKDNGHLGKCKYYKITW